MANAIITLTTDYGTNDHLVGTLKGVILKINPDVTIVDITHNVAPFDLLEHYYLQPVSNTFHGRDIFAPVAAWLSKGWQTASMGEEITDYKRFALPRPKEADGAVKGVVMRTDAFGNLITNFRPEDLPESALSGGSIKLQVGNQSVTRLVDTFARGNDGEPIAYVGSNGYIEIAVNKGNAARTLGLGRGTPVVLMK